METLILSSWAFIGLYCLLGTILLVPIHLRILGIIDDTTVGASWGFRIVISPGLVILWPYVVGRWIRVRRNHGQDRPSLRASRIRLSQAWLTRMIAIVVPILVGAALLSRSEHTLVAAPIAYGDMVDATYTYSFSDLPITYEARPAKNGSHVLVRISEDLSIPTAVLYLQAGDSSTLSPNAMLLGGVWGPASFDYPLPAEVPAEANLIVYSIANGAVTTSAPLRLPTPQGY